ncbi:spore coat protein, partial [Neobacillus sp. LXY-4]|uniref:spore coat protein n=1 Tax=Neobacillus sp. LXY-4 TaxID=3379826 RepID=UPI003EE39595
GVTPDQIQYGLNNPTMVTPETNTVFNDFEVANALLQAHKNAAANGVRATMEIADPNLRHMLLNGAVNCVNQAYEVFLFMNQQGLYQVPKIKDHTAKTFLHSFQPAGEALKAQYTSQFGQPQGQPMMGNLMDVTSGTMATQNMAIHGAIGQSGQSQSIPAVGLGRQTKRGSVGQPSPSFGQMGMGNVSAGSQTNMHQYPINQQH